jgi:hypothetical protein
MGFRAVVRPSQSPYPPTFRPGPVHACHRAGRRRSRQNVKSRGEAAMIACTEKGSAVRLFPTRHGREIAARPGGPHHGCPLGSPSPSPPRREPRPGEVGLAGWGVGDQSCAPRPPPTAHMRSPGGGRGYSARQTGRQLFGGDHHVALASSTSTCPLLPCCTDHCGFGRKRKGGSLWVWGIMRGDGLSFGSLVGWESCNGSMQLRKQPGDLMSY